MTKTKELKKRPTAIAEKEQNALNAYANFLQSKQVDQEAIAIRIKFLNKFAILLKGATSRDDYGKALQTALIVEANIERHQQLNIAREFYPFWTNDVKMIASISETYGYSLSAAQLKPTLALSVEEINSHKLDVIEVKILNCYAEHIKAQNLVANLVQQKMHLAKIILLQMSEIPIQNNVTYRMAVEVNLQSLNEPNARKDFLVVAREFFYIWIDNIEPTKN